MKQEKSGKRVVGKEGEAVRGWEKCPPEANRGALGAVRGADQSSAVRTSPAQPPHTPIPSG